LSREPRQAVRQSLTTSSKQEASGLDPEAVHDNTDFEDVSDLDTATSANILDTDTATVNCPIVSVGRE